MLAGFSALNERSDAHIDHDSSDNGSSSESVDFRDEDYLGKSDKVTTLILTTSDIFSRYIFSFLPQSCIIVHCKILVMNPMSVLKTNFAI